MDHLSAFSQFVALISGTLGVSVTTAEHPLPNAIVLPPLGDMTPETLDVAYGLLLREAGTKAFSKKRVSDLGSLSTQGEMQAVVWVDQARVERTLARRFGGAGDILHKHFSAHAKDPRFAKAVLGVEPSQATRDQTFLLALKHRLLGAPKFGWGEVLPHWNEVQACLDSQEVSEVIDTPLRSFDNAKDVALKAWSAWLAFEHKEDPTPKRHQSAQEKSVLDALAKLKDIQNGHTQNDAKLAPLREAMQKAQDLLQEKKDELGPKLQPLRDALAKAKETYNDVKSVSDVARQAGKAHNDLERTQNKQQDMLDRAQNWRDKNDALLGKESPTQSTETGEEGSPAPSATEGVASEQANAHAASNQAEAPSAETTSTETTSTEATPPSDPFVSSPRLEGLQSRQSDGEERIKELQAQELDLLEKIGAVEGAKREALEKRHERLAERMQTAEDRLKDVQDKINEERARLDAKREAALKKMEEKESRLQDKLDKNEGRAKEWEERARDLNELAQELEEDVEKLRQKLMEALQQAGLADANPTEALEKIEQAYSDYNHARQEYDKVDGQLSAARNAAKEASGKYQQERRKQDWAAEKKLHEVEKSLQAEGLDVQLTEPFEEMEGWGQANNIQRDFDQKASEKLQQSVINGCGGGRGARDMDVYINHLETTINEIDPAQIFADVEALSPLQSLCEAGSGAKGNDKQSDTLGGFSKDKHTVWNKSFDRVLPAPVRNVGVANALRRKMPQELKEVKKIFQAHLRPSFKNKFQGGREEGDLDARALWKMALGRDNDFFEQTIKRPTTKTSCTILVDLSGSMSGIGDDATEKLRSLVLLLSDGLTSVHVPHEILGYLAPQDERLMQTGIPAHFNRKSCRLETQVIKSFKERDLAGLASVDVQQADQSDGESVRVALGRLTRQQGQQKLMFLISDGKPYMQDSDPHILDSDLRLALEECAQKKVVVHGLGFAPTHPVMGQSYTSIENNIVQSIKLMLENKS